MADVVTFDPLSFPPVITEINTGQNTNEIDIREIYSEWKDWVLADASRLGYPPAFRVVGGDPISDTESLGSTFFILAPWKIRPAEYVHRLTLVGNLFTDPAGSSPVIPTLGTYTVAVELKVSTLVEKVSVPTPDTEEIIGHIEDWGAINSC